MDLKGTQKGSVQCSTVWKSFLIGRKDVVRNLLKLLVSFAGEIFIMARCITYVYYVNSIDEIRWGNSVFPHKTVRYILRIKHSEVHCRDLLLVNTR